MSENPYRIRDAVDERSGQGQSGQTDSTTGQSPTRSTAQPTPSTPVPPGQLRITETTDLDTANDDGSITIAPNSEQAIVLYENRADHPFLLHFLGAADALDVQYVLRVGQEVVFRTESPVGPLNEPFVFDDYFGGPMAFARDVSYSARNTGDSDVTLAGRMGLIEPLVTEVA